MRFFAPMLCTWFDPVKLRFPCFVQPKLNGFRAVYVNGCIYSRNGYQWRAPVLAHIAGSIEKVLGHTVILDGELYRHGWSLERIAEALALYRHRPSRDTLDISFYVFDLFSDQPFSARTDACNSLLAKIGSENVQVVPSIRAGTMEIAHALHRLNVQTGFEGSIYRFGDSPYQCGRSPTLMKRKDVRGSGFKTEREFERRQSRWHLLT